MSFPEKIRTLRKLNKLSQEKLAEIMNVSRQAIAKWELGKSYPDIDKLIEISNYFNISIDSLLKEKNNDCNLKKNITKIGEYKMEFKIVKEIAILSKGSKEWTKELNIVKWGENNPKLEIRDWAPNHEKIGKGTTLTNGEALSLLNALKTLKL